MFEVGLSGKMFDDLTIWDHLEAAVDMGYASVELRSAHVAPQGYHPTVASPVDRNTYFWILASFTPESRRYDLAKSDPDFAGP